MTMAAKLVATAGWLHFLQLPAMIAGWRVLSWDEDLALLKPVTRQLFKVIVAFIMLTVMGLGAVVVSAPAQLVDGGRLGIGLCLFLSIFWLARTAIQAFVLLRTFPRDTITARFAARGLVVLFGFLGASYAVAFVVAMTRSVSS
jgi:hypothetical protein